jgi:hypothetical protein
MWQFVYWIVEGPNGREYSDNAVLKPLKEVQRKKVGALFGGGARLSDIGSSDHHIGVTDSGQWPFSTKQAWSLY